MKLTDEEIKSILVKEGKSKTILVDDSEQSKVINEHEKEGWKLYKTTKIGSNKVKLTFTK